MAKIAVEDSLGSVKSALQNSGHEVVAMSGNVDGCACCVISGQDKNVMGIANAATSAAVINAEGMTADEIVQRVDQSLQQAQA
jgi:hypothetical protein